MFATKALRQAAAHAERQPLIKFIGKRNIPGKQKFVTTAAVNSQPEASVQSRASESSRPKKKPPKTPRKLAFPTQTFFFRFSRQQITNKSPRRQPRSTTRPSLTPQPRATSSPAAAPPPLASTASTPSSSAPCARPSSLATRASSAAPLATTWAPSSPARAASSLTAASFPPGSTASPSAWPRSRPSRPVVLPSLHE